MDTTHKTKPQHDAGKGPQEPHPAAGARPSPGAASSKTSGPSALNSQQPKSAPGDAPTPPLLRLATVWFGGCSGCHMSFLDLDEFLLELAGKAELVFSPVMDIKEYPGNVDLCLIEGAICNEDNLELVRKVRARTKTLVSFGDCAVTANVPALRNQLGPGNAESVLQRAYVECAQTNPGIPKEPGIVPPLLPRVMPVHEAVDVNYFLPGCPPPADRIKALLAQALEGKAPQLAGKDIKFG